MPKGLKYLAVVVVAVALLTGFCAVAWGQQQIRLVVNGREIYPDVPPQIIDGRTMAPIRFVAEALGAKVEWNEAEQTVCVTGQVEAKILESLKTYNSTIGSLNWIKSYFLGSDIVLDRQLALIATCATWATSERSEGVRSLAYQWLDDFDSLARRYGDAYLASNDAKITWDAMEAISGDVIPVKRLKALLEESLTLHIKEGLHVAKVLNFGVVTTQDTAISAQYKNRCNTIRQEATALIKAAEEAAARKHF